MGVKARILLLLNISTANNFEVINQSVTKAHNIKDKEKNIAEITNLSEIGDDIIVKEQSGRIVQTLDGVIANKIFENIGDENVDHNGGGIYITSGATVSLVNCDFTNHFFQHLFCNCSRT